MKAIGAVMVLLFYGQPAGKAERLPETERPVDTKVFVITLDGFRWQELFGGADPALLKKAPPRGNTLFPHTHPDSGRAQLMPFMWRVVARSGQVIGNRHKGSRVNVSNPYALSYAGYNELFTGRPDYRIWSNDRTNNGNKTVLEHLNALPWLRNKVASFGSWALFPYIFNKKRSRIHLNSPDHGRPGANPVRPDTATFAAALRYIRSQHPRVLHLGFGGTDEAAHQGDYAGYLAQAHLADSLIGVLWQTLQADPFYRNRSTLLITTDHGRGAHARNWHKHGFFVPGSSQTWMALLGAHIPPLGESSQEEQLHSGMVAGTLAHLLQAGRFRAPMLPPARLSGAAPNEATVAFRQ